MKNVGIILSGLLGAIAIVLILSALGILPAWVSELIICWEILLIIGGIKGLLMKHYWIGWGCGLVGVFFYVPHVYEVLNMDMPLSDGAFVSLVIGAGLLLLASLSIRIGKNGLPKTEHYFATSNTVNKDNIHEITCAFCEIQQTILEKTFNGGIVSTSFGTMTLDLSRTTLEEASVQMEVNNAFGRTIIIVPSSWMIKLSVSVFLGETKDRRYNPISKGDKTLYIKGSCAFGSIEIQSVGTVDPAYDDDIETEHIETISVKHNNSVHIITLDELLYIQAEGDYVTLCTSKGNFLKEQTMKYFQSSLPCDRFIRIHRSYIVNLNEISSVDYRGKDSYYVILKNGTVLRASVTGYQELRQQLDL